VDRIARIDDDTIPLIDSAEDFREAVVSMADRHRHRPRAPVESHRINVPPVANPEKRTGWNSERSRLTVHLDVGVETLTFAERLPLPARADNVHEDVDALFLDSERRYLGESPRLDPSHPSVERRRTAPVAETNHRP
jgi:hypothetical protein